MSHHGRRRILRDPRPCDKTDSQPARVLFRGGKPSLDPSSLRIFIFLSADKPNSCADTLPHSSADIAEVLANAAFAQSDPTFLAPPINRYEFCQNLLGCTHSLGVVQLIAPEHGHASKTRSSYSLKLRANSARAAAFSSGLHFWMLRIKTAPNCATVPFILPSFVRGTL